MGIFNGYLKEGPGVEKNEKKKRGIFLFVEVFAAKFFDLIKANILYFLVSLPFLAISMFFLAPMISEFMGIDKIVAGSENESVIMVFYYALISCGLLNIFGSGPASAAYAYVTRCFTRREHTWLLSDGKDKFKENFKNSMILTVIDIVALVIVIYALNFYGTLSLAPENMQFLFVIIRCVILVIFAVYMMMHIFVYQIMVTYECNFRALIKNALIMTFAKLPMCILLSAMAVIIFYVMTYLEFFGILVYAVIGLSLTRFPLEFYAARVIEKNISTVERNNKDENTENETENERADV